MDTARGRGIGRAAAKRAAGVELPEGLGEFMGAIGGLVGGEEAGLVFEGVVILMRVLLGGEGSEPQDSALTKAIEDIVNQQLTAKKLADITGAIKTAEETFTGGLPATVAAMSLKPRALGGDPMFQDASNAVALFAEYSSINDVLSTGSGNYEPLANATYKGAGAAVYAVAANYRLAALKGMVATAPSALDAARYAGIFSSVAATAAADMSSMLTAIIENSTGSVTPYVNESVFSGSFPNIDITPTFTYTYGGSSSTEDGVPCFAYADETNTSIACLLQSQYAPCVKQEASDTTKACATGTYFSTGRLARDLYANSAVVAMMQHTAFDPISLCETWHDMAQQGPTVSTYASTPVTAEEVAHVAASTACGASSGAHACTTFAAPVSLTCSVPPSGSCASGGCVATVMDVSGGHATLADQRKAILAGASVARKWVCSTGLNTDASGVPASALFANALEGGAFAPSWPSCAACTTQTGAPSDLGPVTCPGLLSSLELDVRASTRRHGRYNLRPNKVTARAVMENVDASGACMASCSALSACMATFVDGCARSGEAYHPGCSAFMQLDCSGDSACTSSELCVASSSKAGTTGVCVPEWAPPAPRQRCPVGWTGNGTAINPCLNPGKFNSPASVYIGDGGVRYTCSEDASRSCLADQDCSGVGVCSFGIVIGSPQSGCSSEHGRACTAQSVPEDYADVMSCHNHCEGDPSKTCIGDQDCGAGGTCTVNTCSPYATIKDLRTFSDQVEAIENGTTEVVGSPRNAFWYGVSEPVYGGVCACRDAYNASENVCVSSVSDNADACAPGLSKILASYSYGSYPPEMASDVAALYRTCATGTGCCSQRLSDCISSGGGAIIPGKYYSIPESQIGDDENVLLNNACFGRDVPAMNPNYWNTPEGCGSNCECESDDAQCQQMRSCYGYCGLPTTGACYFGTPLQSGKGYDEIVECGT